MKVYRIITLTEETDEDYVYTQHSGNIEFYSDANDLLRYKMEKSGQKHIQENIVDATTGNYKNVEQYIRTNNLRKGDSFIIKIEGETTARELSNKLVNKLLDLCK